jgi:hypothetical protein
LIKPRMYSMRQGAYRIASSIDANVKRWRRKVKHHQFFAG